ncbi:hypothetical protein AB4Y32_16115 [Paraburkholderia phymatum]|uniref:Uncharacterized protein n=1 Tax=Paraburkholderia phymatum TaxID=148447 RepID=A0ACC6U154_9BURK
MVNDVRIIDGEWVQLTDWYPGDMKPVRVGTYESRIFDGGWDYFWMVWFDGRHWRDKYGMTLIDQNITWRGLAESNE